MVTSKEKKVLRTRINETVNLLLAKQHQLDILRAEVKLYVKAMESRMTDSDSAFESLHQSIASSCADLENRIKAV